MIKKTVVITGSARGLGYEMAKCFRRKNFNVVISDIDKKNIEQAKEELLKVKGTGEVMALVCDITKDKDIVSLINKVRKKFERIDFFINNAGVNQPDKLIWECSSDEIKKMIDIDLVGTMVVSKYVMKEMIKQNTGSIYMVLGHGSNDAVISGLSIYGTAKRGIKYFASALAKEAEESKKDIIVGMLSPGIMKTNFLDNAFGNEKIELDDKKRKVYDILGDYPDVVAKYLVNKMITNNDNNVNINWLTNRKAVWKFISYRFKKNKKRDGLNK